MDREQAEAVAAALGAQGILAEAADWAGGHCGVEVPTGFVTPDGRTSVGLWVGSEDDGTVSYQYGDYGYGAYADLWLGPATPLRGSDADAVAEWVAGLVARHEAGEPVPEPFETGLRLAYADILEG